MYLIEVRKAIETAARICIIENIKNKFEHSYHWTAEQV